MNDREIEPMTSQREQGPSEKAKTWADDSRRDAYARYPVTQWSAEQVSATVRYLRAEGYDAGRADALATVRKEIVSLLNATLPAQPNDRSNGSAVKAYSDLLAWLDAEK